MDRNDEVVISLPKSRICVIGNELIKKSPKGDIVSRHPIFEIKRVDTIKKIDPIAVAVTVGFTIIVVITNLYIPSQFLRWVVSLLFACVAVFSLFGMTKYQIKLTFKDESLVFDVFDDPSEGIGFALSLKRLSKDAGAEATHPFDD